MSVLTRQPPYANGRMPLVFPAMYSSTLPEYCYLNSQIPTCTGTCGRVMAGANVPFLAIFGCMIHFHQQQHCHRDMFENEG